ncbi:UNVERIFIED_ORG: hypothetical protein ABIC48_003662 [Burkholderia territorii]
MQIAAAAAPAAAVGTLPVERAHAGSLEIAEPGQRGEGRGIQIGGAADQRRDAGGEGIQHLAGSNPRCHAFRIGRKNRDIAVPPVGQRAAHRVQQRVGQLGKRARIRCEPRVPVIFSCAPLRQRATKMRERRCGDMKRGVGRPPEVVLGQAHLGVAERRSVRLVGVLPVGRAITEMRAHEDQRRTQQLGTCVGQRRVDCGQIVAVVDRFGMPAVGVEPLRAIFGEGDSGAGGQCDPIVVVQADQLAEPEMAGKRCGFRCDAFHQVAVADKCVGVVIHDLEAGTVVARGELRFRHRHADGVGEALAERAGRRLDARREAALRMAGREAARLPEAPDLIERQVVAG